MDSGQSRKMLGQMQGVGRAEGGRAGCVRCAMMDPGLPAAKGVAPCLQPRSDARIDLGTAEHGLDTGELRNLRACCLNLYSIP